MASIHDDRSRGDVMSGTGGSPAARGPAPGRATLTGGLSAPVAGVDPVRRPADGEAPRPSSGGADYREHGLGDTGDVMLAPGAAPVAALASEADLARELDRDIELAVFTTFAFADQRTFAAAARQFAADHRAVGLVGGRLLVGGDAAMGAATPADVVHHVQATIAAIRAATGRPGATVATLALFSHGLTDRLNWAREDGSFTETAASPAGAISCELPVSGDAPAPTTAPAPAAGPDIDAHTFAASITAALGDSARVVLYACLAGSTYSAGDVERADGRGRRAEAARDLIAADDATGGDGSFADTLRDELDAAGGDRAVWAHRTAAHTTGNPTWRAFDGAQGPGERASDDLFGGPSALAAERVRADLASAVAAGLGLRARFDRPSRAHQLLRGARVVDREFGRWVAREVPFVPDDLRPLLAASGGSPDAAVVAWFVDRYRAQRGAP
jgi:hypothetical protein